MNTHPICNSPLCSFAPLQKLRRKEITVLIYEQEPYPVWFSRRRKSYPVLIAELPRAQRSTMGKKIW